MVSRNKWGLFVPRSKKAHTKKTTLVPKNQETNRHPHRIYVLCRVLPTVASPSYMPTKT